MWGVSRVSAFALRCGKVREVCELPSITRA